MDLSEPGRGLAGGLTVPILRALAGRSSPATAAQLTRVAGAGTEAGVRRALERLAAHGLCASEELGGRVLFTLNRDHVLYGAVAALLKADAELPRRLERELATWDPLPSSAVLFGSAARGDGNLGSDVDVLLIRPPRLTGRLQQEWLRQVHELRGAVLRWTGNRLQVLDWTVPVLQQHDRSGELLVKAILAEGLTVAGSPLAALLRAAG